MKKSYKNTVIILIFTLIIGIFFITTSTEAQQENPAKYTTDLYLLDKDNKNFSAKELEANTEFDMMAAAIEPEPLAECLTVKGVLGEGSRSIPFSSGAQKSRIFRDGIATNCARGKVFPGTLPGNFKYDSYRFENASDEERCITVRLNRGSCRSATIFATAYVGCFNPNNIAQNYIADSGTSSTNQAFSFSIPAKSKFVLVVSSIIAGEASCNDYSFSMAGMQDCGNPDLNLACTKGPALEHNAIFFTDTANNRIQKSTDEGLTWTTVGAGEGDAAGHFNSPRGIATSANGQVIFVADTGNHRVQRTIDGGQTWVVMAGTGTLSTQLRSPQALAYDENQDILYIADTGNSRILKMTDATTKPVLSVFAGSTSGQALGQFLRPSGIAVDSIGRVYVADTGNNRIQLSTTGMTGGWVLFAGASSGTTLGKVNAPVGIFIDSLNRVYIADTGNNRVQINKDGSFKGWSLFMGEGTALGTVNAPEGIVLSDVGNVFVSDTLNNRIQRRSILGGTSLEVVSPGFDVGESNSPTSVR